MTCRPAHDRGVALVEVLVALLLLSVLAVGAAALGVGATRAAVAARAASITAALARQKHEQLRALTWAVTVAGVPVTDTSTDISTAEPSLGGPGTGASPPGALDASLPGFSDYADADGRWIGTGPSPPSGAAFARRWRVDRLAGSSGSTLVVRVLAMPLAWSTRRAGRGATTIHESEATLVSLRTRTTR